MGGLKERYDKMRIYSNTVLSWPQVLPAFQAAHLYQGRWYNYYFYKINHVQPYILTTYSPLEFLQENCQYYCYDKYYRDKRLEEYGNAFTSLSIDGKKPEFGVETWGYIPKVACANDIILIKNDDAVGLPSARGLAFTAAATIIAPSFALQ